MTAQSIEQELPEDDPLLCLAGDDPFLQGAARDVLFRMPFIDFMDFQASRGGAADEGELRKMMRSFAEGLYGV